MQSFIKIRVFVEVIVLTHKHIYKYIYKYYVHMDTSKTYTAGCVTEVYKFQLTSSCAVDMKFGTDVAYTLINLRKPQKVWISNLYPFKSAPKQNNNVVFCTAT